LVTREVIHPQDLHEEPFIAFSPEDTVQQALNGLLEKGKIRPRVVVETLFSATVQTLVAQGVGIGLVNPYAIDERDATRLVLKRFEPGIFARTLLLLPPDRQRSHLVTDMVDTLMGCRGPVVNGERRVDSHHKG
jgi:DNA-binding transcriptional LysR family regulator